VLAAEVTSDRLANPEPGNWLMNHRTYDSQRHSRSTRSTRPTSSRSSSHTRSRSAGRQRTKIWNQPRSPRTATST
jgi:hypothetical protein